VTPTVWGALVIGALVVLVAGAWLITRDTATPPKPPGRHRRPHRRADLPLRQDDEPPPGDDAGDEPGEAPW
jgi:hypothetical protein